MVIHAGHSSGVPPTDTIGDEPGRSTLDPSGVNLVIDQVLSHDTGTVPVAAGVVQGEPDFVVAANGGCHLLAA